MGVVDMMSLLEDALSAGGSPALRAALVAGGGLGEARLDVGLVRAFAGAAGAVVRRTDPPVDRLEALLDGWAAVAAPAEAPEAVLPCAAVAAYGVIGVVRPDWFDDEVTKLRLAAADARWPVRAFVVQAIEGLLEADWSRTADVLLDWVDHDDPLVVAAAVVALCQHRFLADPVRARTAAALRHRAAERPPAGGRAEPTLHNVTLYAPPERFDEVRAFYTDVLGLQPAFEEAGHICCLDVTGDPAAMAVCIHEAEPGRAAGGVELFFRTRDADERVLVDPMGNHVRLHP